MDLAQVGRPRGLIILGTQLPPDARLPERTVQANDRKVCFAYFFGQLLLVRRHLDGTS